jgi:hypothetical protein
MMDASERGRPLAQATLESAAQTAHARTCAGRYERQPRGEFALHCGFAVERISKDYGLDLAIFTFDQGGFLEGGVVWVQLKATDHLQTTRDGKSVLVRIDRRDLLAWMAEANPTFLVLYDALADRGYWLSVRGYFAAGHAFANVKGKTVTIAIPKAQRMSGEAMREFAREKNALRAPRGTPS